jgi:hypothetical protein
MAMDLHTLQSALERIAATRGDDRFDHPRHLALALAAEAGAALDRFRWLSDAEAAALDEEACEAVARAAVAAMLYAMRLAARTGADVAAALAVDVRDASVGVDTGTPGRAENTGAEAVVDAASESAAAAGTEAPAADRDEPYEATLRLSALPVAPADAEVNDALDAPPVDDAQEVPPGRDGSHAPEAEPGVPLATPEPAPSVKRPAAALPAPSRMVAAASAAFARAQAAAARVNRSFAAPAVPDRTDADLPDVDDELEPTITLDAGPAPTAAPARASPTPAAGTEPPARSPGARAVSGAEARSEPGTARTTKEPDRGAPTGAASRDGNDDAKSRRAASDTPASTPPDSHGHGARGHEHKPRDPARAEGRGQASQADETGSHSGRRNAHARQAERGGATGNHAAHGKGHGRQPGERPQERRHGDGPQGGASTRTEHDARHHGHGESLAGERRSGRAEEHGGRRNHEARGEHREDAGGHHRDSAPPRDRYAKLDFEAVQGLRKSMARMLEGVHRKDPLLRELAEELETLRRTLYSNAAKPAWVADTLLTIRRMLEESVGDGLGDVLDAERRIAAIDALLQ